MDPTHRSRSGSTEKPAAAQHSRPAGGARVKEQLPNRGSVPPGGNRERETSTALSSRPHRGSRERESGAISRSPRGGGALSSSSLDFLPADIRGILDDLHLEDGGARSHDAGRVDRKRADRSPSKQRLENTESHLPRKRHYDSDSVRRYIAKQQEERKRRQADERRSQREEQERRSQRLQELYKKQREGVTKQQAPPPGLTNPLLQETYTKMLLGHTLQRVYTHARAHTYKRTYMGVRGVCVCVCKCFVMLCSRGISRLGNPIKRTKDWNHSVPPPANSQNTHRLHCAGSTHTYTYTHARTH